ncbi:MAG: hypothetical protein NT069_23570 [Planctomycetota bacterium]|nr:hypothetical protein [Planctomycetota bacterium]
MRAKPKSKIGKSAVRYPREGFARIDSACEFLQVGRTTLFRLMAKGTIQTVRLDASSHRRIPWPALWEFKTKLIKAGGGTAEYVDPKPAA